MSDLDLKPLAKAIDAVLPAGHDFVLIVRGPGERGTRPTRMISALAPDESWSMMDGFVKAARNNKFFNPGGK